MITTENVSIMNIHHLRPYCFIGQIKPEWRGKCCTWTNFLLICNTVWLFARQASSCLSTTTTTPDTQERFMTAAVTKSPTPIAPQTAKSLSTSKAKCDSPSVNPPGCFNILWYIVLGTHWFLIFICTITMCSVCSCINKCRTVKCTGLSAEVLLRQVSTCVIMPMQMSDKS